MCSSWNQNDRIVKMILYYIYLSQENWLTKILYQIIYFDIYFKVTLICDKYDQKCDKNEKSFHIRNTYKFPYKEVSLNK